MSLFWYLLVMAGVTYLIRMLPLTLLQKKIRNRRLQSFLYLSLIHISEPTRRS